MFTDGVVLYKAFPLTAKSASTQTGAAVQQLKRNIGQELIAPRVLWLLSCDCERRALFPDRSVTCLRENRDQRRHAFGADGLLVVTYAQRSLGPPQLGRVVPAHL